MLRIIITSLFMVNAIFWGIYPPADTSPHSKISLSLGFGTIKNHWIHLAIGTLFYMSGVLIAQQQYIQHLWC